MKKQILLLGLVVLSIVMCASAVSAMNCGYYGYCYGTRSINPEIGGYYTNLQAPARIGGFFGENSEFIINLRPGVYTGPVLNTWTRQNIASAYYPRIGGNLFSFGGYYNTMSPGMYAFNNYGNNYGNYGNAPYVYHGPL